MTMQLTDAQLEELVESYLRREGYGGYVDALHDPKHPNTKVLHFLTDTVEEVSLVYEAMGLHLPEDDDAGSD